VAGGFRLKGRMGRCRSDIPLTTYRRRIANAAYTTAAAEIGRLRPPNIAFFPDDAKLKRVVGERKPA
jgi:hypothetical protein